MSYTYEYPRPSLTADCVILYKDIDGNYDVLLIKRKNQPFKDMWALPGGYVDVEETTEDAAYRELQEETSITDVKLKLFHVFDAIDRDPRGRSISIVYKATVSSKFEDELEADTDAKEVAWFSFDNLPELAFDHEDIINKAHKHIKTSSKPS